MRTVIFTPLLLAVLFAVSPAQAETYKWVDDDGVTHYSDRSPSAKGVEVVAEKISVYKPDERLKRAMAASPATRQLEYRIASLEDQLRREQAYRAQADYNDMLAADAAYRQCLQQRRVDCDGGASSYHPAYYPAYAPIVVGARRVLPFPAAPARAVGDASPVLGPRAPMSPQLGGTGGLMGSSTASGRGGQGRRIR